MESTGSRQLKLIKIVKQYISNVEKRGVNSEISSICYMQTFGNSPGFVKLKKLNGDYSFSELFSFTKNLLSITNISKFKLTGDVSLKKYEYLFISWANKSNFLKSGKYVDRYFNIDSKKKNILWLLIHIGDDIPKQLDENVLILSPKKNSLVFKVLFLLKYFFFIFLKSKFNFYNIYHQLSEQSCFAYYVDKIIRDKINLNNIKKIFIPLESQPFQNLIIKNLKRYNGLKIVGYDHSIDAFPINNMYKKHSPDVLYVHSKKQKKFYSKYLYWPKRRVIHTPSTRFFKRRSFFENKIFFSYNLSIKDDLIKNLEIFLKKKFNSKMRPLKVQIHPFEKKSIKHINFKNEIISLLKKYKNNFSQKSIKKTSIFLGATSSAIEALQNDCDVVHIVSDPVFEAYSDKFWPSLKIKKISENIFHYSKKIGDKCLTFRKEKNSFVNFELK